MSIFGLWRRFTSKHTVATFLASKKKIVDLRYAIENQKQQLADAEYKLLVENKDDIFLSLSDFLEIMKEPNISIQTVLLKCKHRAEISESVKYFDVDVYTDSSHIIICLDKENCDHHRNEISNPLKLVTLK
ncbi:MAG TPA: hypothetical protein P5173_05445 [Bacilli bacterium]|nr:hypothetical protein [Bacilli bacterium]